MFIELSKNMHAYKQAYVPKGFKCMYCFLSINFIEKDIRCISKYLETNVLNYNNYLCKMICT